MKAVCRFCGFRNKIEAATCAKCGGSLADARREKFRLPWASWVPILPFAIVFQLGIMKSMSIGVGASRAHKANVSGINARHQESLKKLQENFNESDQQEEARHQARLKDPNLLSGSAARERHSQEWTQRQLHDPKYISTILEKTLVEVERLGKDPNLTAEAALKKVTELVCPPGSRIEITPKDSRFVIRVAFRLSAVAPMEAGTFTLHNSSEDMRRQVEDATARLIRSLFDYCGSRGIERISVSCNRALVEGEPGNERLAMRSLYRVSINAAKSSEVSNWRELPVTQIKKLIQIEKDTLSQITFQKSNLPTLALDPNQPLEF